MGTFVKQSIVSTVFSYLGIVLGYINLLVLFPFAFDPAEIGMVRFIQDMALLLVPFSQLGLTQTLLRYYPGYANSKELSDKFLVFIFSSLAILSLLTLGMLRIFHTEVYSLFNTNAPEVEQYSYLIIALIFILSVQAIFETISRILQKILLINFIKEIYIRLVTTLLVTLFIYNQINFDQFLFYMVGGYLLGLLVITFYVFALHPITLKFGFKDLFDAKVRPESLFFYSITTVLGTGGMLIVSRIDSIMITSMIGLPALAIYSISFYIATVIEVPKRPITQLTTPLISFAMKSGDYSEIKRIYSMVSLTQFAAGALLFLGIWVNIDFLFYYIPNGEYYAAGKYVVLAIGLGKLIDLASGNNGDIIVMSDYYKFNIILVSLLAILTILSNYLLIPAYGFTGAAIASAISIFFYNLIKFLFIYLRMKLQPFNWLSLIILNITILIFILGEIIPHYPVLWVDMIIRTSVVIIVYLGVVFKLGIYKFIISKMR